jgi:hypothetical protein
MPGHRIIIRVLSKSGVSRVERSRNQCNATSTRITTAAIESIIGGGLMMRKGERLRTSRTRICLASSARTASAYDVAVEFRDTSIRLHTPFLSHQRPTSQSFEISKVQSEVGPNVVMVSLPNLNAASECRRLPLRSRLANHRDLAFVNEGATPGSTDFTRTMKILQMCRMMPDHMAWRWKAERQTR